MRAKEFAREGKTRWASEDQTAGARDQVHSVSRSDQNTAERSPGPTPNRAAKHRLGSHLSPIRPGFPSGQQAPSSKCTRGPQKAALGLTTELLARERHSKLGVSGFI